MSACQRGLKMTLALNEPYKIGCFSFNSKHYSKHVPSQVEESIDIVKEKPTGKS